MMNLQKMKFSMVVAFGTALILASSGVQSKAAPVPDNQKVEMAITVDDLPSHGETPPGETRQSITEKILSVLLKHNVPEVYGFINYKKAVDNPAIEEVLNKWLNAGYPLASHTYSHPHLRTTDLSVYLRDIEANEEPLKKLMGERNWKFFRYPFLEEGDTIEKHKGVREFLHKNGYSIAQVTVDFEDWSWNDPFARCAKKGDQDAIAWLKKTFLQNGLDILERNKKVADFLYKRPIKHILLLHIGGFDALILDELLSEYEKRGVKFIGLSDAVTDDIYKEDPEYVAKSGTEFIFQVLKKRGQTVADVGLPKYQGYPWKQLKELCPDGKTPLKH